MPKIIDEDEVFKAVIKVVTKRGYDRATTLELATAAKIHEATLFRKYGSKVGLIEQAIEHLLSKAPMSQLEYTGDLQADLTAILDAYAATTRDYGAIIPMILLELPRYPELRSVLETPIANIHSILEIITRYQIDGLLKKEPPLTCLNALLAPILLSQMLKQASTDLPSPPIELPEYIKAFLSGRKHG